MKTLFLLFLFPCIGYAGPYYEVIMSTTAGTSTMTVSGYIGVAASSTTPTTYKFRIDGPGGYIQFPDGTQQTSASPSLATYAQLTATQTFTGANTFGNTVTASSHVVVAGTVTFNGGSTWTNGFAASSSTVSIPDYDTASQSFVTVAASTLTITVQAGSRVMAGFCGHGYINAVGVYGRATFGIGGVDYGDAAFGLSTISNTAYNFGFTGLTDVLSAGTYGVYLRVRSDGGNLTTTISTDQFWIKELR